MYTREQTLVKLIVSLYVTGLPDVERVTPSPHPKPKTCSDVKPDAVVTTKDKRTYVFSGKHFWEIKDFGGSDGPFLIQDYWRGLEDNIDASYTQSPHGHTIFLKGNRYVTSPHFCHDFQPHVNDAQRRLSPSPVNTQSKFEY